MTHPVPTHEIGTHYLLDGDRRACRRARTTWPRGTTGRTTRPGSTTRSRGRTASPNGVLAPDLPEQRLRLLRTERRRARGEVRPLAHQEPIRTPPASRSTNLKSFGLTVEPAARPRGACSSRSIEQQSLMERVAESAAVRATSRTGAFGVFTSRPAVEVRSTSSAESAATRDRYGRHLFGAIALAVAPAARSRASRIVQAHMGAMNNWDTHTQNCQAAQGPPRCRRSTAAVFGPARRPGRSRAAGRDAGGDGRRVRPDAEDGDGQRREHHRQGTAATTGPGASSPCSRAAASAAGR